MVALLHLVWPSLCSETFALFACRSFCESNLRLTADLDEVCFVNRHLAYVLLVGVPMLLLYVFGLPTAALVMLKRLHARAEAKGRPMSSLKGHLTWGMLYSAFRAETWWWEGMPAGRKILVLMVGVFGASMGRMQVSVVLLAIVFVLLHTALMLPYGDKRRLQRLEMASLVMLIVTLWAGSVFKSYPRCEDGKGGHRSWCSALSVAIGLADVLFVVFVVAYFLYLKGVLASIIRKLCPKGDCDVKMYFKLRPFANDKVDLTDVKIYPLHVSRKFIGLLGCLTVFVVLDFGIRVHNSVNFQRAPSGVSTDFAGICYVAACLLKSIVWWRWTVLVFPIQFLLLMSSSTSSSALAWLLAIEGTGYVCAFAYSFWWFPTKVTRSVAGNIVISFKGATQAVLPLAEIKEIKTITRCFPCSDNFYECACRAGGKCFWGVSSSLARRVIIVTNTCCANYEVSMTEAVMHEFIRDNLSILSLGPEPQRDISAQGVEPAARRPTSAPPGDAPPPNNWTGYEQDQSLQTTMPRPSRGTNIRVLRAEVGMPSRRWSLNEMYRNELADTHHHQSRVHDQAPFRFAL